MQRHVLPVLLMSAIGSVSVTAEPLSLTPTRYAQSNVRPAYVPPPVPQNMPVYGPDTPQMNRPVPVIQVPVVPGNPGKPPGPAR